MDKRLEQIKKGRKCNRLSWGATREEVRDAHKVKMRAKKIVRDKWYKEFSGPTYIGMNLSRNHPDYGMTIAEHTIEKYKRQHETQK